RCYNLHRVLHSHGALRQPTPHGIFRHIHNVTFHHSHCDANRAEINRAIRTRRMASPAAERLAAVTREAAVFSALVGVDARRVQTGHIHRCLSSRSFAVKCTAPWIGWSSYPPWEALAPPRF